MERFTRVDGEVRTMRLIDADALAKKLTDWSTGTVEPIDWADIAEAPTIKPKAKVIAQVTFDEDKLREIVHEEVERIKEEYDIVDNPDAVSVVRCKECKFCVYHSVDDMYRCKKTHHWFYSTDHYCSYGERRDNGKDIQSADE